VPVSSPRLMGHDQLNKGGRGDLAVRQPTDLSVVRRALRGGYPFANPSTGSGQGSGQASATPSISLWIDHPNLRPLPHPVYCFAGLQPPRKNAWEAVAFEQRGVSFSPGSHHKATCLCKALSCNMALSTHVYGRDDGRWLGRITQASSLGCEPKDVRPQVYKRSASGLRLCSRRLVVWTVWSGFTRL
jgi:hypothetical protein